MHPDEIKGIEVLLCRDIRFVMRIKEYIVIDDRTRCTRRPFGPVPVIEFSWLVGQLKLLDS